MTGRELSSALRYTGMETDIRTLALKEKMETPDKLAVMSREEVCNLVSERYEMVYEADEELGIVKINDIDKFNDLVTVISR